MHTEEEERELEWRRRACYIEAAKRQTAERKPKPRHRSTAARSLRSQHLRQRVRPSGKLYRRKGRPSRRSPPT